MRSKQGSDWLANSVATVDRAASKVTASDGLQIYSPTIYSLTARGGIGGNSPQSLVVIIPFVTSGFNWTSNYGPLGGGFTVTGNQTSTVYLNDSGVFTNHSGSVAGPFTGDTTLTLTATGGNNSTTRDTLTFLNVSDGDGSVSTSDRRAHVVTAYDFV